MDLSNFAISQIFVGIAFISDMISFQLRERTKILVCILISVIAVGIHYWFLGQYTGAALCLLAATRYLFSIFTTDKRMMFIFIGVALAASVVTFEGVPSLLALAGSLINTVAAFQPKDKNLRLGVLAGHLCWLSLDVVIYSPIGIMLELVFLGSNLIGLYRFYGRRRAAPATELDPQPVTA